MVDVFKLNKDMDGNTYYIKPIPIRYNGKLTYNPPFSFVTAYPNGGFDSPIIKYFSYCIVNDELKLVIYGSALFKIMDIKELIPVNNPKVVELNVKMTEGFLNISDSKIINLDDYNIKYKDNLIIKSQLEYDNLIKDIDEGQLYQIVTDECNIVLSYTKDKRVIDGIENLLSSMRIRMRGLKIKKIIK